MVPPTIDRQSRSPRVVIVDDDEMVAEMVETRLARDLADGVTVTSTTDSRTCLTTVHEGGADCVVSDYDMPNFDGLELLRRVRELDDGLPFVLYTGRGSEEIASEAISVGVTDYIRKGGTEALDRLSNSVQRALAQRRTEAHRDAARRSLAAKDATLESLFESLPSPSLLVDIGRDQPTVRRANSTFARRFGVAHGDVIGAELPAVLDADTDLSKIVADGETHRSEISCETVAGAREFLATVVPAAGDETLRYLVFTDISEQKRLQRSLTALHEATRELLSCDDAAAVECTALEAAADVIGFPHNGTRRYDPATDCLVPSETTAAADERFETPRSTYHKHDAEAAAAWRAFEAEEVVTVDRDDHLQREGVASKVYLPVGKWGLITLSDPERSGVDETDEYLGRILAANMAAVLAGFDGEVETLTEQR